MLRRDRLIRMQAHELLDACLFALSFFLAHAVRDNDWVVQAFGLNPISSFEKYVWLYLLLIPAAPMVLEAQGFYNRPVVTPRRASAWLLFKACTIICVGLIMTLFLVRAEIARSVIILFGFISFGLVMAKEELARRRFFSRLGRQHHRRRVLLIGTADETAHTRHELRTKSPEPVEVAAEVDLNQTPTARLQEILHDHSINGVVISAKRSYFDQVEDAIRACEMEGVEVWLVADFFRPKISRTTMDDFYGRPVLVFRTIPETSWQSIAKQMLDLFGATLLLVLLAIPLGFIALLVKLSSPGPIFFRQERSGLNGRPFTIYKFRTMVTNAEQLKHELAAMNEMDGPVFKVSHDPRITGIGRLLRKFSLDEFPQLVNVVRGEMSLVGPRPLPVDETKRFNDLAHRRRLSVKPGLTCLWQIRGRNNVTDFKEWVRLDLEYIDNWSFWLDLKILLRTLPVVLAGTGAK